MPLEDKLAHEIQQNHSKIQELELRLENISREESEFLNQLNVSLQQLVSFASEKGNFTESNWEELANQKKKLEEKLQIQLSSIKDPRKTKLSYSGLQSVQRHWIHVR